MARADEGRGDGGVRADPAHGERDGVDTELRGEGGELLGDLERALAGVAGGVHGVVDESPVRGACGGRVPPSEQASTERGVGKHTELLGRRHGQELDLGLALHEVVHRLNAHRARPPVLRLDSEGFGDLPCGVVRERRVEDLAGGDEVFDASQDLLEVGVVVEAVQKQHVEPVGAESAEAGIDGARDVASRCAAGVGVVAGREVRFGHQHDRVALMGDEVPEHLLGDPAVVDICAVEGVDAGVSCGAVHLLCGVAVGVTAEGHRAERELGDTDAGAAKESVLHARVRAEWVGGAQVRHRRLRSRREGATIRGMMGAFNRIVKRLFDVLVAAVGLLALSPLLAFLLAVNAWVHSWPPLFVQTRPGLQGRLFQMYKLRTMTNARGADGELLPDAERLTAFGQFLRRTSLDELPELINVLKGEMSLVGPRPLMVAYLERYSPEQARRHEVKPGITGWAQVNGRNAQSWEERLRDDVWYVDHASLALDLRILWRTARVVLGAEGISAAGDATMPPFMGTQETAA